MASMLRDVRGSGRKVVNADALKSEIREALINQKANACPIAARMAWHAAGTYNKFDGTGGCNGADMRFSPERDDPDNAGLSIIKDLLLPIKKRYPDLSFADLWAFGGCCALEFLGGPTIPFNFGREDFPDASRCPANGRLPDAAKGSGHLRDVFGRMGFTDQEIVALSGAHTLGRCHIVRSGFDGPWTTKPLKFDNEYYQNLLRLTWKPRRWDGKFQFEDEETGTLMMLPTDIALIEDPAFRRYVELYASNQDVFFKDFAAAYGKLLALGCPESATRPVPALREKDVDKASAEFREHAMHGSVIAARKVAPKADIHALEGTSGRSALHKAAFWGHVQMMDYLLNECRLNPNVQDFYGDTALHDTARFGHLEVVRLLIEAGANPAIKNKLGEDALTIAVDHGYDAVADAIRGAIPRSRL